MSEDSELKPKNSELVIELVNLLRNNLNLQVPNTNLDTLSLEIKLNGDNYQLWATLMKKAVGGHERRQHFTVVPPPPITTDPNFT